MVPLDAELAANLAAFGTPWRGGARRTRRLEETGREMKASGYSILGGETIPWFEVDHDREIVIQNYEKGFESLK